MNYPQLVADITSHPRLVALLINERMHGMLDLPDKIKASHLNANVKGKQAFLEDGLNHIGGLTSLCYWYALSEVKTLCDEAKKARQELKSQFLIP